MKEKVDLSIDSNMAKEIMTRFLEQHHTIVEIEDAILKDDIWTVIALLSSPNDKTRKVRIDGNTGRVIDWSK